MSKTVLFDTDQVQSRAKARQLQPFKVKQIFFELFKNQNIHREAMTTLSKELRADLASTFVPLSLEVTDTVETEETTKFAFQTQDGQVIEAVLMFHRGEKKLNRITLCISSQIGCPLNCLFCVTGKLGFQRNLRRDEIISQILYANRYVKQRFGKKEDGTLRAVRNVVFMGMGEPLLNYENIIRSIEVMLAQDRLSLGKRHVTISTAGIIP